MTYLDRAATTPVEPEVVDAMMPYFTELWQNPSSLYSPSPKIKADIEDARKIVADFIHAKPSEIIFTSGASEANNTIIQGFVNKRCEEVGVITSEVEHHSIFECFSHLKACVKAISVDENGMFDIDELKHTIETMINKYEIKPKNILVSLIHANNETGVVNPIKEIAEVVHSYGCYIHSDCTQSLPHINVNVEYMDVDAISASGHKLGAPKGIGFLYLKDGLEISPLIYGSQENGMRGGTENVPYIIGLAKAIEIFDSKNYTRFGVMTAIDYTRGYFISKLEGIGCRLNGCRGENSIPTCINVQLPGVSGEAMLYSLDVAGIQVSTGSACNAHSIKPSHVLEAMGLTDEEISQSIRISFPEDITISEIDDVVTEIDTQCKLLRGDLIDASILNK